MILSRGPWFPSVACLTPVCGLIPAITLVVEMGELSKPSKHKEDLQDPGKAQGVVEAQLSGAEVGEAQLSRPPLLLGRGSHPGHY